MKPIYIILFLSIYIAGCSTTYYSEAYNHGLRINDKIFQMYSKEIKKNPKNVNAIIGMADFFIEYYNKNQYYTYKLYAEELFNKAIKIEPNNPKLYIKRANFFYNEKWYDFSINDVNKALEIDPKNEYVINYLKNMNNELFRYLELNDAILSFIKKSDVLNKNINEGKIYDFTIEKSNIFGMEFIDDSKKIHKFNDNSGDIFLFYNFNIITYNKLFIPNENIKFKIVVNKRMPHFAYRFYNENEIIEISEDLLKAINDYFGEIKPSKEKILEMESFAKIEEEKIKNENEEKRRIERIQNRSKYLRIYDVLERTFPGENYLDWIINERNLMVKEIINNNESSIVLNKYYSYVFTNDGSIINRGDIPVMSISALPKNMPNRILNKITIPLSREGIYNFYEVSESLNFVCTLIIKELCKIELKL